MFVNRELSDELNTRWVRSPLIPSNNYLCAYTAHLSHCWSFDKRNLLNTHEHMRHEQTCARQNVKHEAMKRFGRMSSMILLKCESPSSNTKLQQVVALIFTFKMSLLAQKCLYIVHLNYDEFEMIDYSMELVHTRRCMLWSDALTVAVASGFTVLYALRRLAKRNHVLLVLWNNLPWTGYRDNAFRKIYFMFTFYILQ